MKLENLTQDERSLLLFFEAAAVDYGGKLNPAHMNKDDFKIAERWNKDGFVKFGRVYSKDISSEKTHWCFLSEDAFILAHEERRARHKRIWDKRNWKTTEEKRNEPVIE